MADRKIHISDGRKRNAEINFKGFTAKKSVKHVDSNNEEIITKKYIKATAEQSYSNLFEDYEDPNDLAQAMVKGDPEINLEMAGRFIQQTSRVFVNNKNEIVFNINKNEVVYNPQGEVVEEREPKILLSNILGENPLKWSGKYFKKEEVYNKFVFVRKYQLKHTNGLTFDMLYEMAKDLADKKSLMLIGSGKGTGPIVFQDGGKPFRAFLEGRVNGDNYLLILHLSNMELKPLQID